MTPMVRRPLGVEQALLGFLTGRPMYGYEIHQCLSQPAGLGRVWRVKQSQAYALLARLEALAREPVIWLARSLEVVTVSEGIALEISPETAGMAAELLAAT